MPCVNQGKNDKATERCLTCIDVFDIASMSLVCIDVLDIATM